MASFTSSTSLYRSFFLGIALIFSFFQLQAQRQVIELGMNGKTYEKSVIQNGVYCLDNGDTLSFDFSDREEGKEYIWQGIFVYAQLNLGKPQIINKLPDASVPYTIALNELIPEDKIPPYSQGGTRVSIVISRVIEVEGSRAKNIIPIPTEERLTLLVVSGCRE